MSAVIGRARNTMARAGALSMKTLALSILGLFVMPVLATMIGAGAAAKLIFPLLVLAIAVWLAPRDPPAYLRLLLWTLVLAPGLRHYVDSYLGFSNSNPIMMAPYLVVAATLPAVLLHLLRLGRFAGGGLLLFGLILMGLGMAFATGELAQPVMRAIRWASAPLVGFYIIANADRLPAMREAVLATFRVAVPAAAAYGIVQYVFMPAWDAAFLSGAPYTGVSSFGYPVPFGVRVFGTMNSPGSLASMLLTGMLLLLPCTRGKGWAGILLGFMTLLLTTQRAAFGGFVLGTALSAFLARDLRLRRGLLRMSVTLTIATSVLLTIPSVEQKLERTFGSVFHLQDDGSAQQRWQQYQQFTPLLNEQMLGRGLAWEVNPQYIPAGGDLPQDSGLIEILVGLGVPGGLLFLGTLAMLAAEGLRIASSSGDGGAVAEVAAAIAGLAQLPLGSQFAGEPGIFLFMALGLVLARRAAWRQASGPRVAAGYRHRHRRVPAGWGPGA